MDLTIMPIVAVLFITMCYILYKRRKHEQTLLSDMGLTGPEPHWLFGSMWEIMTAKIYKNLIQEWTTKYGGTFGYYEGSKPVVVTDDVDIIREVLVKQFHNFNGHKRFPLQPGPDNEHAHMFLQNGPKWKRVRTICNPSFSSGKIKWMTSSSLTNKLDSLVEVLRRTGGKPVDTVAVFQALMLDIILDVAFGISVEAQNNPNAPLLRKTRNMFEAMGKIPLLGHIATVFPIVDNLMFGIAILYEQLKISKFLPASSMTAAIEIGEILAEVIDQREKEPKETKRVDLTQSLIDAEIIDETAGINGERKLSKKEIIGNTLLFLMAGYETTSSTLAFASYLLAVNPVKQGILQEEIDSQTSDEDEITYTSLSKMPYLDMVVCETLRIFPIAGLVMNRQCNEDTVVNGMNFTKGVTVQANIWAIHNDPELWGPDDTSVFEPERFLTDRKASRHPMAWIPFGAGPRACLGQRMAMIEAKMSLARVLKEFSFVKCEQTEDPPELKDATISTNIKNGLYLKVVPRHT